ncbi:response regulator [Iningainema tapete]|uniref:histidine kinase n=1 Tax=Iningainema tapete BLCC-T55 TaxID=2748662 RepID=A0A8J6XAR8_9CYAN|nr:response regulator [Iningainema tapete]MBD2771039.1 response regulator [Iningainema tapete BLCC-T55]
MLPEQQQRILGYFIEEALDHLNTIEQGLLNLQSTLNDSEMINEVFRAAHSIKGGAAMLGLSSIQRTAHRLEDCFKDLKEHPVQVDQKLESLFLGVSDTLKALLEQLQSPYGLSEEAANTLMSEAEPVFTWLHEHLELLIKQKNNGVATNTPTVVISVPPTIVVKESDSKQEIQNQVIQILREMLQLFKQTATSENRHNLQECCHQLAQIGENLNWLQWCNLCRQAASAIKNPNNTYLNLAKIVITDIRQGLELVLIGKEAEITTSEQLEALIGFHDIEFIEIPLEEDESLENSTITVLDSSDEFPSTTNVVAEFTADIQPQDCITSLLELEIPDQVKNHSDDNSILNSNLGFKSQSEPNGPVVGIAELTELDDLFKDDTTDLDDGIWVEEEISALLITTGTEQVNNSKEDVDTIDFFLEENHQQNQINTDEQTLVQLFGKEFLEEDNKDSQSQEDPLFILEFSSDDVETNITAVGDTQIQPTSEITRNVSTDNILSTKSEVIPHADEILSLDDLFASVEEETSSTPHPDKSSSDLVLTPPVYDLNNFWEQEEENNPNEESAAVALQEILLATTGSEDIFETSSLIDVDDFFAEFSSTDDNSEVSAATLPPEAVELTPNFTTSTETVVQELPSENEIDWFNSVQPESIDHPFTVQQQNLGDDDLLDIDTLVDFDFADPEFFIQTEVTEVVDIENISNLEEENLANFLLEPQLAEGIEEPALLSFPQEEAQQKELEEVEDDISIADEFALLDHLLGEQVASGTSNISLPQQEISALEELLNSVPKEVVKDTVLVNFEEHFQELEQMVKGDLPLRPSVSRAPRFEQLMKVPVKHLDDLSNLVGELVVNRNTLEQDQERLRQSLDNLLIQVQQLSDVGARMQELYERSLLEASLLASRKNNGNSNLNTDRGFSELEMDRFTPFHSLSGEMIELIVRVRESASDIDFVTEETERVARQFRQVTTQLQEGITRSRMEAFGEITTPLERGVRENAIKYEKQAQLVIEGRDTLIDKMILEHLKSPMTHLLNNAIAHGIETSQQREAVGKKPVGVITVRAFHQGNQTIISVSDDGAGIDIERVKAKALHIGLITPQQAQSMSRIDVYDLLFQPGFSTKDEADLIGGRGVGMDVVRTKISEVRGTITTDSTIGKGTTFTIRLPLTLSICKALCCVSDKARIAFPMDGVEDTLDIHVKNVQQNIDGQKFIQWRDIALPFKPLKELLTFNRQLSRGNVYGGNRDDDMISVVVVRSANTMIALQIDQVLSEQEIVIKQFEGPAPKPIGVAGATVLGDGRIMPIADVLEIIDIFQGRTSTQRGVSLWDHKSNDDVSEATVIKIDPTVLIVDDSITVRELLSLTFNKAGYRVEQARDGQEAWDKLRSGLPCDIVFCDIEMPRCDGLELLSRIQKDTNLNHLPIAMLTSRGADKHRQMAIQLGASGYFTKPYLEEALLEAASRMLKGEKLVVPIPEKD